MFRTDDGALHACTQHGAIVQVRLCARVHARVRELRFMCMMVHATLTIMMMWVNHTASLCTTAPDQQSILQRCIASHA